MRTISTEREAVLSGHGRAEHVRVQVKDGGGTFRNLSTYPGFNALVSAKWGETMEEPHATATVVLRREVDRLSLAPLVQGSALNHAFVPTNAYAALLAVNREFTIEVAVVPMDRNPASGDWELFFHGRIDSIDPGAGDDITLTGRDLGGALADCFIETERVYNYALVTGAVAHVDTGDTLFHFSMDEASGDCLDSVGTLTDMFLEDFVSLPVVTGVIGNARSFTGSDTMDANGSGNWTSFSFTDFTIGFYYKPHDVDVDVFDFSFTGPTVINLSSLVGGELLVRLADGINSVDFESTGAGIVVDAWHHVAITRNGTSVKLYINAVEVPLTPTGTCPAGTLSTDYIYFGGGDDFDLDDFWFDTVEYSGPDVATEYTLLSGSSSAPSMRVWEPSMELVLNEYILPSEANRNGYYFQVTTAGTGGITEPVWPTSAGTVADGSAEHTFVGAVTASGAAVELAMQAILDDNLGAGVVELVAPDASDWDVKPWVQSRSTVLDALTVLATQRGWAVRYRYSDSLPGFELTFYEPERTKTVPDRSFTKSQGVITAMPIERFGIRNVVRVVYSASGTLASDGVTPQRLHVESTDATSRTAYGRLFMEIAEDDSSQIDTEAEATRMADAALADLKDPVMANTFALTHGFPWAELGDLFRLVADNRHFSADQDLALFAVTHEASGGSLRTELQLRGKPTLGVERWLSASAHPAAAKPYRATLHETPSGPVIERIPIVGGVRLQVLGTQSPHALGPSYEHYISSTAAFIPTADTLVAISKDRTVEVANLTPGATYYHRMVPRAMDGAKVLRSQPSVEVSFVAGFANAGHLNPDSPVVFLPLNYDFGSQSGPVETTPPDHWVPNIGDWGASDDIYESTSVVRTGSRSIHFRNTAVAGTMDSSLIPCQPSARLMIECAIRSTDNSKSASITVFYWSDKETVVDSEEYVFTPAASDTWEVFSQVDNNRSDTKFISLLIGKDSPDTYSLYIDYVRVRELDIPQQSWIPATLVNSWVHYGSPYSVPGRYKDSLGVVHLRGLVKDGTATDGAAVMTLPVGYRPPYGMVFATATAGGQCEIRVETSGDVNVHNGASATYVSLDGISFRLD